MGGQSARWGSSKGVRVAWLLVYLLSPAIPLYAYFAGNWYTVFHSWSLAMIAGILAYTYILNQFILGGRPRYFDRIYGVDKLLRFHTVMGSVIFFLLLAHLILKSLYLFEVNLQVRLGQAAFGLFVLVILASLVFMGHTILVKLRPLAALRRFAARRLRLQYQHLRLFHNLTAIAIIAALAHVLLAASTREQPHRTAIMAAWWVVAVGFYVVHKFVRPLRNRRRPFEVTQVRAENQDTVTVALEAPDVDAFSHKPGQFAFFRVLNGTTGREEHPFTISSGRGDGRVTVTSKAVGDWTTSFLSTEVGHKVAVDGPYGVFSYVRLPVDTPVVFVAGGIGITPFLSMLESMAHRGDDRRVELFWAVRKREDLIRWDTMRLMSDQLPNLRLFATLSRDEAPGMRSGRPSVDWLEENDAIRHDGTHYYLCGPVPMMEGLIRDLKKRNIPTGRIHFEKFAM